MKSSAPEYQRVHPLRGGRLQLLAVNFLLALSLKLGKLRRFTPAGERQRLLASDAAWFKPHSRLRRESMELVADGRRVPALRLSMPVVQARRVLLYLHGGAFMFRFPNAHAGMLARCCDALQAVAWVPQYRLAPEDRFPAAIDDCFAAWLALRAQGVAADDIVIAGDSAGGNLTLALLHRLKAAGEPMPACAVMLSPVVDMTLSGRSMISNEGSDPMFDLPALLASRGAYLRPEQVCDPSASPLFADMHGYPPLLFQASRSEMLRDDSVRAAAKAHAAGVTVELELWERMPHAFQLMPALPQAAEAIAGIVRFIRKHAGWN
jgi:epsilon-lactone hydrolase